MNEIKQKQTKKAKKESDVIFKLTTSSIVRLSPQAMQWYH